MASNPDSMNCIVVGCGGHARVVIDCLVASGKHPRAALDANRGLWGTTIDGVPVLGDDSELPRIAEEFSNFVIGIGQVGDAGPRQRLYDLASSYGLEPLTVLHPLATISENAILRDGAQILPGAIINAGAKIGINAIVNSGAIIEHDCIVGNHTHVASGARLGGGVRVEDGVTIGIGATICPSVTIGKNAFVGAGSLVLKDIRAGATVIGVPAAPIGVKT